MISSDQVSKVIRLANLHIQEGQLEKYSKQLSGIVDYIDQLKEVETGVVEPLFNVSANRSNMREDEIKKSLSQDDALQNTLNKRDGFFVTKGVFSDE